VSSPHHHPRSALADLHVLNGFVTIRASCSTPNSSKAWTSASRSDRWLRWFRLQTLTQDFPPKCVDKAAGFSAHLQCRPLSPCPRLSIVSTLMPAAASCATPPVLMKRKRSNARSKTRMITEGKYPAVPRDIWLSAFGNTLCNRFLPRRASTPVASICYQFVAEVRIATRNVAARLLIWGSPVSKPIRYGP